MVVKNASDFAEIVGPQKIKELREITNPPKRKGTWMRVPGSCLPC